MPIRSFRPARLVSCLLLPAIVLHCADEVDNQTVTTQPSTPSASPAQPELLDASATVPDAPPLSCGGLLGASTCDPVTAWPCDVAAGETCEFSNLAGAFRCYSLPTAVPFCGACDRVTLYCGVGTTCGDVFCERYCCQDSDCEQGRCVLGIYGDPGVAAVGFCPEDSAAACGSTLGAQIADESGPVNADAGSSP